MKNWTPDEEKYAKDLRLKGHSVKEIALAVKKSVPAVECKLRRLEVYKPVTVEKDPSPIKNAILSFMKSKSNVTLLDLARGINFSVKEIEEGIEKLKEGGYEIKLTDRGEVEKLLIPPRGRETHIHRVKKGDWIRFGVISDPHLSNREHRADVLNTAYDHFGAENIDTVYLAGNMIDGYAQRINAFEIVPESGPGVERQIRYTATAFPQKKKIKTYFISGACHEGWYGKQTGLNVGKLMGSRFEELKRPDLEYSGHIEADIEIRPENLPKKTRGPIIRLMHPSGGSSYAVSYKVQKYTEHLQEGEKPQACFIGHYHKHGYFMWRGVHCFLAGCIEDQTIFMRNHQISAHVGYWLIELFINTDGIIQRFRHEWIPFFDRGFYKKWEYF